ncbi:MAG: ATP-binding protein [Opitutaceae bacterium]
MREKIAFCWSGGKDSALALHRLRADDRYEVVSLLTTCNADFRRVSMHGVRLELLERQADALGLPLEKVFVGRCSSNEEYESRMGERLRALAAGGTTACAFGDIFLEDLRRWREGNLARIGMRGIFPLWKIDTRELVREFIASGFGSVVCCVNDAWLGEAALGRTLDEGFVRSLPPDVDPCGENGEYHSFAFAGPIFLEPIQFSVGEKVYRPLEESPPATTNPAPAPCPPAGARRTKGFWFCDLLPT